MFKYLFSVFLTKHEVVGPEDLSEWTRSYGVHCPWLQVDKNGSWNIFTTLEQTQSNSDYNEKYY